MDTRLVRSITLLLSFLLSFTLNAQIQEEFRLESITSEYIRIEQGLSQNTVNCILQDSRGFLWIGTWSGLNRFDGYTVKTFNREYYHPDKGISNPTIIGIIEDNNGYIWAATTKGLNRIHPLTFEIKKYFADEYAAKGLISDSLSAIYYDSDGLIWLGTSMGAVSFDPVNETFTPYHHNPRDARTLSDRYVTCFEEDSLYLWIGTRNGLNQLSKTSGSINSYYEGDGRGYLSSSYITCMDYCENGNLWVGTNNGLNRLNKRRNWIEPYFLISESEKQHITSQNYITAVYNDSASNELWVGTQELGLYILNKDSKRFNNISKYVADANVLNTNTILDIIRDETGLFWIGTSHRGLMKLIPEPHAFRSYLRGQAVYGITEQADGLLWFGTQNGVFIFDRMLNRTVKILENDFSNPNSLSNNRVTNIFNDGEFVWISTRLGLNKYDLSSGNFERFLPDQTENSIAGAEVWGITKDSKEQYWFSTQNGLSKYDPQTMNFVNFRHDPNNPNTISSNHCYQVFELEENVYLVSTAYGLNRYNQLHDTWEVYLPIPGDLTSISSESIFGVFRDRQNEIWIYTNGGGINRFDPYTNSFEHFTSLDGLSDNIIYGMLEDEYGSLWLTTNNGLSRFDPGEERFIKFDAQDGLLSNEFNFNGFYQSEDKEIFAAGVNGVSSFFAFGQKYASDPPAVQFTSFVVHEEGKGLEIPINSKIELEYDQNTFHVGFAVPDYLNPFKNRFVYKLINFDNSITTMEAGVHQIEYRKLPPGNYVLSVTGYNSIGYASENSLEITILPAWWQTFLFKASVVVLSILLLSIIIYLRYKIMRNRHLMEKKILTIQNELVQSQKFALRSQMNPHFIFNSLNSIQNFVLKNDVDAANYYLSNFSTLMRKVLEYSQYNLITLYEEIQLIDLYIKMEKLRFSEKFDVRMTVDPKIDEHQVKIPPMLLQPYLENAILHGLQLIKHRGLLAVRFMHKGMEMLIEIEDNGIGRARANEIRSKHAHKSKGLKNIEKRIQLYNKINPVAIKVTINDLYQDDKPTGTLVSITIPYELDELES